MKMRQAAAAAKTITAAEAAAMVKSGMWIDYLGSINQPDVFDRALGERISELSNLKLRSTVSMRPRAVMENDPEGRHVHMISLHMGSYDRRLHEQGRCSYTPLNLGEISDYYRRFIPPVDIVIFKARPLADGVFNVGPTNVWLRAVLEQARLVIIETCSALPFAFGEGTDIHLSEVDYIIEGDDSPVPELPNPAPTEVDKAVARLIISEIEDGACLQIGIGGMPNAVCGMLASAGIKDLGVHTEMLTDGIAELYRAGQINGTRKALDPGKIIYCFAAGTKPLFDTVDRNPDFWCHPAEYTNSPHIVMQNPKVTAINSTTQIDLTGQAASESDGNRHLTGTGGQAQFVRGAYASEGGKSFICLPSTYDKKGDRRSRIVFNLTQGNIVTTTRADMMYVVTEYGIVNLKGKSVPERARALIGLAHPDFREGLERQAYENRLIPRGFSF
ncbi:acetyl-CoA hydrolase/transferase C-terminal domain-containing protein [Sandarakinorhabdus sp.]|uniref:acetyl-CoA hydrolase/transferase family protein n=1 Tax=Sandarakinorhabdus sp. TaxID=1916663 RepID=UPI00286D7E2E|nr:acetyl-CoA hydrolase/transferase C-terminal domain-containing protein [Sandarakinorhabdus sp.]